MFRAVIISGGEGGAVESVEWQDFTSGMAAVVWARGWIPNMGPESVWGWFTDNMAFCGWGAGFTWREFWVIDESGESIRVAWGA